MLEFASSLQPTRASALVFNFLPIAPDDQFARRVYKLSVIHRTNDKTWPALCRSMGCMTLSLMHPTRALFTIMTLSLMHPTLATLATPSNPRGFMGRWSLPCLVHDTLASAPDAYTPYACFVRYLAFDLHIVVVIHLRPGTGCFTFRLWFFFIFHFSVPWVSLLLALTRLSCFVTLVGQSNA